MDYLFFFNKFFKVINFEYDCSYLCFYNLEYWLYFIVDCQIVFKFVVYDVVCLLMIYNEYWDYYDDFMMKGVLLFNKIQ